MRSQSHPTIPIAPPGSWVENERKRDASLSAAHRQRQRDTSMQNAAVTRGLWADVTADLRPSTVATLTVPGGGLTQGAHLTVTRPHTIGSTPDQQRLADSYDISRHGWYTPEGQAEMHRLGRPSEEGSWAWTMRKSGDHNGYSLDGGVRKGDIQISACSGDGPTWFVGPRTMPGPYGTRKVPVRRCPVVQMDEQRPRHAGQQMRIRAKTYSQGHNLSTVAHLHEDADVPNIRKEARKDKPGESHKAKGWTLEHGGCVSKKLELPASRHRTQESYSFDYKKASIQRH